MAPHRKGTAEGRREGLMVGKLLVLRLARTTEKNLPSFSFGTGPEREVPVAFPVPPQGEPCHFEEGALRGGIICSFGVARATRSIDRA